MQYLWFAHMNKLLNWSIVECQTSLCTLQPSLYLLLLMFLSIVIGALQIS